jgi:2-oxo-3-hexenedioate decarboxylase
MDREITAEIARAALAALDSGAQVQPFGERHPGFGMTEAYSVTAELRRLRIARGERPVGRKIGFTNRRIWPEYGVHAPIWGDMYDSTVGEAGPDAAFALGRLREPKIEPEIAFGLSAAPRPGMDEAALLGCIGWAAQGFEIVHSIFPGWRFAAADTVSAFALHGGFVLGPRVVLADHPETDWPAALSGFSLTLLRNGAEADRGHASDVLGGPLTALAHLVEVLSRDPVNLPLAAGEIITTGTATRAFDVAPGEDWQTRIEGLPLPDLGLRVR